MSETVVPAGFRPVFRRSNVANRKRVRALERRLEYLRGLGREGRAQDYDRAEAKALEWALEIVGAWIAEDPIIDVDAPEDLTGDLDVWVSLLGTGTYLRVPSGVPSMPWKMARCEIVGVNPQERRIALRFDDLTRPVREGILDNEIFIRNGAADDAVSL